MTWTRAQIAAMCRQYGPQVGPLPSGLTGVQVLWAIAGNESSFGDNCTPRHEPAYDAGGAYASHAPMPRLLAQYGYGGACSYGPWQVMLCNAPAGYGPKNFVDLSAACGAAVLALNTLLRHFRPGTLAEIGECYNAGHITPDPAYTSRLAASAAVPMPS